MTLAAGTRFGQYQIAESIGAGGMGVVYRATDTSLKRDVAIKILPPAFAGDTDRVTRFQREAEALAALNHPNIAQIYGLERSAENTALVMEFVEGPTLADRITDGPMAYTEALGIALQIADALEAAHGRGIVHRDLKPANIKVRPDGTVKVLDFGIATAPESPIATSGRRSPARLTPALTEVGVLLGTAAYMSPEQARGKPVDERADIWAFGCLLYEMLTGQPAYGGEDVTSTLARVLERDADLPALPADLPAAVRQTIKLCLEKNLKKRVADIRDVRLALEGAFETERPRAESGAQSSVFLRFLPHSAALLIGLGLAALVTAALWPEPPAPPAVTRFSVTPPDETPITGLPGFDLAISPDGLRVLYLTSTPDGNGEVDSIYVRDLDRLDARLVAKPTRGTAPVMPFFSADGSWIGYYSGRVGILRVPVDGGPPVTIVDDFASPELFRGAAATKDGTLIYATTAGLYRVSSGGGGKPELLVASPENQVFFGPALLPSERAVLLTLFTTGVEPARDVVVFDLDTREQKLLLEADRGARYASTGHLVFGRNTTLMAVPFDVEELAVTGEPVALFEGVRTQNAASDFGLSASGTLIYLPATAATTALSRIVWVGRDGQALGYPIDPLDTPRDPRLSPDGRRLLLTTAASGERTIGVHDLEGRPSTPIATGPTIGLGVWSPDGTQVAFASTQPAGYPQPYVAPADGTVRNPAPLRSDGLAAGTHAWSANGDLILVTVRDEKGVIVAIRADDADSPVREVAVTADPAVDPALSPDGRWLAYVTSRTGGAEVWVKRYPDGTPQRVSEGGGLEPVWARNGRELYYMRDNSLMAVAVETSGDDFSFDRAVELFRSPYITSPAEGELSYDVDADGRFLMIERPGGPDAAEGPASIVVVQNWLEELKRRVPRN